jgi:hypothetical protein
MLRDLAAWTGSCSARTILSTWNHPMSLVPVLAALGQHAPRLLAANARRLLDRVPG